MNQNSVTGIGDEVMLENIRRAEECHIAAKTRQSIDDASPAEWDAAYREVMAKKQAAAVERVKAAEQEFNSRAAMEQKVPAKDNAHPAVWPLVMRDMIDRDQSGREKYGVPLKAHNGRDTLLDAYQEALDLAVYLRTAIYERDGR